MNKEEIMNVIKLGGKQFKGGKIIMEYMEYMNWLKNKYGNTNLSGFKLVSEILESYVYPVNVMKIYKELAEKHNLKYQAVERNIRTYKNACGYKDLKNSDYINSLLLTFQLYLEKLGVKNIYE